MENPATTPTPTTTVVTSNAMTPQPPADIDFTEPTTEPVKEPITKEGEQPPVVPPKEGEGTPAVVPPVTPPAPSTFTPEQVASLIEKAKGTPAPTAPVAPPKPLTPEEIDAKLNTVKIVEADVNELLEGGTKAVGAMQRIVSAAVKNAVTVSSVLMKDEYEKLMGTLNPHIQFAQEQQRVMTQNQYFSDNPTHVGLEPLVAQVAQQLVQSGFKGSAKETFSEVAKRVNDLVAKLKIPTKTTEEGGTTPPTPTTSAPARMSTVTTGGQGGAGGAKTKSPEDPEAGIWS